MAAALVAYACAVARYWWAILNGAIFGAFALAKDTGMIVVPEVPSWLLWSIAAASLFSAQFWAYMDLWKRHESFRAPIYDAPILDVIEIASDHGWDWVDGWQYWDLQAALSDAAANGLINVWGRQPSTHPLYPSPPVLIRKDILERAQLKLPLNIGGGLNRVNAETTVMSTKPGEYFRDLQVSRAQIVPWIKSQHAKKHIGNRVKEYESSRS